VCVVYAASPSAHAIREIEDIRVCGVSSSYGVASVSRIDSIIGLFCKRDLYKRLYSAKETCNLIHPTNRSHPIVDAAIREIEANCVCGISSSYGVATVSRIDSIIGRFGRILSPL